MQTCGNTSLPLRFSSDFLVSTKCKVQSNIFAVQSLRNSPAQCFKPAWYSNFSNLSDSLVDISFYLSLLEAVSRGCRISCFFTAHDFLAVDYS